MKGGNKILFLFLIFLLLTSVFVFFKKVALSYDTEVAHPFLAEKAVILFNQSASNKLSVQEIGWVKQGAEEEDTPIRWMNHFYDPNTGYGIVGFAPTYVWAKNSLAQSTYLMGDQTWQTAITAYNDGDKRRAFIALGHVLHLIEDMTVPAHTRMDMHPEGDPYEEWAKINTNQKLIINKPVIFSDFNDYFNSLASYSNKYFLSKKTINVDSLKNKRVIDKLYNGNYIKCVEGDDSSNKFCLVELKKSKNGIVEYAMDAGAHSDYFSLLAPKAISYGAGIIDLFFKQAEIERNKKLTFLEKFNKTLASFSGVLITGFSNIFGTYQSVVTDYSNKISAGGNSGNNGGVENPGQVLSAFEAMGEPNVVATNVNPSNPSLGELGAGTLEEGQTQPPSPPLSGGNINSLYQGGEMQEGETPINFDVQTGQTQAGQSPTGQTPLSGGNNSLYQGGSGAGGQSPTPLSGGNTVVFIAGDSTAPETSISSAPSRIMNSGSAVFIFTSNESNSNFECKLNDAAWTDCGSPRDINNLADGDYVFKVRARDASGNLDPTPAEHAWTIDTTAPRVTITDKPAAFASSSAASFVFSSNENNSSFTCNLDLSGWPTCVSPVNYENLLAGEHNFKVKAKDAAGNESLTPAEFSWTVSFAAPSVTIAAGPPDISSSTAANFQFTSAENYVNYQCNLDTNLWQLCSASTTAAELIEGNHSLEVRGLDRAGNTGSSTIKTWLVDLTAPTSTIADLAEEYQTTGFTVRWSGEDADATGATTTASGLADFYAEYKIDAGDWQNWINATTSTSTIFSEPATSGQTIYFHVRARDYAGNAGEWSAEKQTKIGSPIANHAVISEAQISGASANDEFIELYNPTAGNIDLSSYSIQYRGSNALHFYKKTFATGSVIKAKAYYLIASSQSSGAANADLTYASFNLSGEGGTIFLVDNPAELADDTATSSIVIDRLAYGSGSYLFPEGAAYLTAPTAGQSLERKAFATSTAESMAAGGADYLRGNGYDSNNNNLDFILKNTSVPQSAANSLEPRPEISLGLTHLWHFDECEGDNLNDSLGAENLPQNAVRVVGKWQCAVSQSEQPAQDIKKTFSAPLPAGELTYAFYSRSDDWLNGARQHVYFKKSDGSIIAGARLSMYDNKDLYFPGGATTTIPAMPDDKNWHLITVTHSQNSLVYYLDGVMQAFFAGDYSLNNPIVEMEITGENWTTEMDEIAVWSRALGSDEVADIYSGNAPLSPYDPPTLPPAAERIHWWHFDEGAGATIADSVGGLDMNSVVAWTEGKAGSGLGQASPDEINQTVAPEINSKSLSVDFWWQNSSYPEDGRGNLILQDGNGVNIFGLMSSDIYDFPNTMNLKYYFDGGIANIGNMLPRDGGWHHLALVYDSYNLNLYFYVDGVEKLKTPKIWFRRPITKLIIKGENWPYKLDELAIWRGALTASQVLNIYQGN